MRHASARWVNLASVLCWRDISPKVRIRFPAVAQLVDCGLMTNVEFALYSKVPDRSCRWFLPLQWTQKLIERRIINNRVNPTVANGGLQLLYQVRASHRRLYQYDWVCMPLVYTQVGIVKLDGFDGNCRWPRLPHTASSSFA